MVNLPVLKKTCMNCGLQKPLASFLQLGGPEGTTYGNICADCRKAALKSKDEHEHDEGTTRRSGDSIKPENRIHAEITKQEEKQRKIEAYKQEKEKDETQTTKQEQTKQATAHKEKAHREELEFLKKIGYSQTNKTIDKQQAIEQKQFTEQLQKSEAIKEEEKLTSIDLTTSYVPSGHGAEEKIKSRVFRDFMAWVGKTEPNKTHEKVEKKILTTHITQSWKPASDKSEEKPASEKPATKPTSSR